MNELYHFSEDPGIERFVPHVAKTAVNREPLVWAVDGDHQHIYFFPRQCPRVTFYASARTSAEDMERFFAHTSARKVVAIESSWLPAMRETALHRYTFPGDGFALEDASAGYWVSRYETRPLRVEPVGDLLDAHASAGVEVRITPSLWPLRDAVVASTVEFSIIRWRNAAPGPPAPSLPPSLRSGRL